MLQKQIEELLSATRLFAAARSENLETTVTRKYAQLTTTVKLGAREVVFEEFPDSYPGGYVVHSEKTDSYGGGQNGMLENFANEIFNLLAGKE